MAGLALDLQPMSIGDILDRTVRLYQRAFLHTLGIVAVPYLLIVPAIAMGAGSFAAIQRNPQALLRSPAAIGGFVLTLFTFGLAFLWLNFVSMGALARSVSERFLGRTPTIWTSYQPVLRRSHSLVWAYLLWSLLGMGALVVGVVAPIIVAALLIQRSVLLFLLFGLVAIAGGIACVRIFFRFFLVTQVIVIEGLRGIEALKRSWKLMRGNEVRILGVSLFGVAVGMVGSLVLRLPIFLLAAAKPGLGMAVLDGAMSGLAQMLVIPLTTIPLTLLYYDSRIRKEAFDLEMMARDLGAPQTPSAAGPAAPGSRMTSHAPTSPPASGSINETLQMPSQAAPPPVAPVPSPGAQPAPRAPTAAFKVCPKCNTQVPLIRPTCPNCGTPVPFRSAG